MSDLSDSELPDLAVSKPSQGPTKRTKHVPYSINLPKEIELIRINFKKEQEQLRVYKEEQKCKESEENYNKEHIKKVIDSLKPLQTIPDEAPGREFIECGASFLYFNADNLVKPPAIKSANTKDFLFFHQHTRSILQDLAVNGSTGNQPQNVLEYLLLLSSVHPDEYIVDRCTDLLVEFNGSWEINHKLLVAIFQNWGADISQVLPAFPRANCKEIAKNRCQTVSEENVNAVLTAQLKREKRRNRSDLTNDYGLWNVDELVFGLLILLGLDSKFVGCYPALVHCICQLLDGVSERVQGKWASDYSQILLCLETDNHNLISIVCRILNGSLACEDLRRNVSFAAIQRITGVPLDQINHSFELEDFKQLSLFKSMTKLLKLEYLNIFYLLIFVDTIVRDPRVSNEGTLGFFYKWLTELDMRVERQPHLAAKISDLRVLWDEEANHDK